MYVTSNLYNTLFGIKSSMTGGGSVLQLIQEKRVFLFKVFLNLLVQLAITYFVMTKTHLSIQNWILFICTFLLIIIIAIVPMPIFVKFLLFSIFSFFMGVLLSQDIQGVDKSSIQFAIIGVACIFLAMMLAGIILLMLGIQLGFFTFILLFIGLLVALLLSIIQLFSKSINQLWLSNSIIALFAMFIIYDTQQILRRNYNGDFITASMDYYLDIINIFVRLLKR
jgi:FtsH-binding integral membrane protein